MSATQRDMISIPVSPSLKKQFEQGAQDLHLSAEAYLAYLLERVAPGVDAERLDRHASEVFGKHGDLVRRLAK